MTVTVIDASSIAKYLLREDNWEVIRKHLADEPHSLNLALAEVSNAIWKHYALYKEVSHEYAERMFQALKKLKDVVVFEPLESYLDSAMDISIREKITVYDALYIAQAKKLGSLLTSDGKQKEVAEKLGIGVEFVE